MLLVVQPIRAEEFSGGSAAELVKETNLLRGPQEDAEIVGKLPKGTILTTLGDSEGDFIKVEVELVDGIEQGWISEESVKSSDQQRKDDEKADKKSDKKNRKGKKKKRQKLPDDELAVIRREPTFAYGIYGGGNYGLLASSDSEELYMGFGGQGGGFIHWFLNRESAIGLQLGITQLSGAQATINPSTGLAKTGTARLFDVTAIYEYLYQQFRFFGGLQYSFGIGIADFPPTHPPSASDLSGVWLRIGGGYAFPLSDVVNLVAKGIYGISFNREYVGFQSFGVSVYLEFRG